MSDDTAFGNANAQGIEPPSHQHGADHHADLETHFAVGSRWAPLRPTRNTALTLLIIAVGIAVIIGIWDAVIGIFHFTATILPTPLNVWVTTFHDFRPLMSNAKVTLEEAGIGFGVTICIAIPLGVAFALSRPLYRSGYPFVVGFQAVPKIALAPLLIVWFGFGINPRILLAVLTTFFPLLVNTISGVRSTPPEMLDVCAVMRLGALRTLRIRLTYALPQIFAGAKVAASVSLIGALAGEFIGGNLGLGVLLVGSLSNFNTALMWSCIVFLSVFGLAMYFLVELLEILTIPWHASRRLLARESPA